MKAPEKCRYCGSEVRNPVGIFSAYYVCGTKKVLDQVGGWRRSAKCYREEIGQLKARVRELEESLDIKEEEL